MPRALRIALVLVATALVVFIVFLLTLSPREDRVWSTELSRTVTSETRAESIVLTNVRDFQYAPGTTTVTEWRDVEIDPAHILRAWFVFEPFPQMPGIGGHTYLTFELDDGTAYSFSIEARKEADENYSAFQGLFRKYELSYLWSTERDSMTRRALLLNHGVHMYPLHITRDDVATLFRATVMVTDELAAHPRFYNTLTANCTNLLAQIVNTGAPNALPYDIAWNLPGRSEEYLRRMELISGDFDLTPYLADIGAIANEDPLTFSKKLRELPPLKKVTASGITE